MSTENDNTKAPRVLYLVTGEEGKGSNWHSWDVCGYHDKQMAHEHAELVSSAKGKRRKIYDPHTWTTYPRRRKTRVIYDVLAIPFRETVPTELDPVKEIQ